MKRFRLRVQRPGSVGPTSAWLTRPIWLAVLGALAACEHPIAVVSPHVEAADLIVSDLQGQPLTRTEYNRSWTTDSLVVIDGDPLVVVLTAIDFRGEVIELAGRADLSFRLEAEEGSLIQWEPLEDRGILHPFGIGETRVRFMIWHINHADFVTPWLRLVVRPPPPVEPTPAPEIR